MPAGSKVLPFRSNIPEISKFVFNQVDEEFYNRAIENKNTGFFIIGGENYGQGSSREHAALAPRYLGLKIIIAKSFARIHWQNLVNFGILPLLFINKNDFDNIEQGDVLEIGSLQSLNEMNKYKILNRTKNFEFESKHTMSRRQTDIVLAGGLINIIKNKIKNN